MGYFTTGKTTKKRDQCISRKEAEIANLRAELSRLKSQKVEMLYALEYVEPLLWDSDMTNAACEVSRIIAKVKVV